MKPNTKPAVDPTNKDLLEKIANQTKILDLIRSACREKGISLLLVTHAPEVAAAFDRVETLSQFNQPGAAA